MRTSCHLKWGCICRDINVAIRPIRNHGEWNSTWQALCTRCFSCTSCLEELRADTHPFQAQTCSKLFNHSLEIKKEQAGQLMQKAQNRPWPVPLVRNRRNSSKEIVFLSVCLKWDQERSVRLQDFAGLSSRPWIADCWKHFAHFCELFVNGAIGLLVLLLTFCFPCCDRSAGAPPFYMLSWIWGGDMDCVLNFLVW